MSGETMDNPCKDASQTVFRGDGQEGSAAGALTDPKHSQPANLVASSTDASCQQALRTVAIGQAAGALTDGKNSQPTGQQA